MHSRLLLHLILHSFYLEKQSFGIIGRASTEALIGNIFNNNNNNFQKHDLFHHNQHGGLPSHNTCTALIQIYENFLENAENQNLSAALLLDQTAAYDLLDHSILLKKMAVYGFSEQSLCWVKSFLEGRTQCVQVEAQRSERKKIGNFATPQGSVLGGLFYIINQNDFPGCRDEGSSVLFVDDDTDIVNKKDPDDLAVTLQTEADNSCAWLKDNKMIVAGDKTKLLVVGTRELRNRKLGDRTISVVVDGKTVLDSEKEVLLGVTVNNTMTWREHTKNLITELSKRAGMIKKLSRSASKKKLELFASGLFYSKLEYCLPLISNIWGLDVYKENNSRFITMTKEESYKLQVLQNKVSRLLLPKHEQEVCRMRRQNISTTDLMTRTNVLSVHQLGAYTSILLMKKILESQRPYQLAKKLSSFVVNSNTRTGSYFRVPNLSLSISREGFMYKTMKLYNMLPTFIREETNLRAFKREVKSWVNANVATKP